MQLALGTAQFGLAYGIAGRGESVPDTEIRAILEDAAGRGVRLLDTATDYGHIEARLRGLAAGLPFEVISKIPRIPPALSPAGAAAFALESATASQERLGTLLRGLMVHNATDLVGSRGDAVWPALERWARSSGVRLGASCYDPDECSGLARVRGIDLAQLPGNALDQRLIAAGSDPALRQVEIHLRSVFLQGLLLMPLADAAARLPQARPALERWHAECARRGATPLEAALSIAKSFARASAVVVGVDNLVQWTEIAHAWDRVQASSAPELACDQLAVIDPRLWSPVVSPHPRRVAIIQARMSSSRFPGKVLAPLHGMPTIVFMVERVRLARLVDHVVVATSTDATDDDLARSLAERHIDCFRGNLDDVLDRFTRAAREARAQHVVRLTGDCPLMDADLIDRALAELAKGEVDYVSNIEQPTYPNGLDVECFTMAALETAWRDARLRSEREHVTPFLRKGGAGTRVRGFNAAIDFSALRWTVDHPDDLEYVARLVNACVRDGSRAAPAGFDRFDLYRVIERDALGQGAAHDRNEGYLKSLAADA